MLALDRLGWLYGEMLWLFGSVRQVGLLLQRLDRFGLLDYFNLGDRFFLHWRVDLE
jgi:hypothetical protein